MVYVAISRDNQSLEPDRAGRPRPACRCSRSSSRGLRRARPDHDRRHRSRPSARRACATSPPATTGCSRSSTSTRASRAPTARRCGCTRISGRGRTGSVRPATCYGDPVKVTFDPRSTTPIRLVADKVDSADRQPPADTDHGQAHQDSEHDPDEVVGAADLSRRDRAAAEGLRQASRRRAIRSTTSRATSRSARPAASAAAATFDQLWLARRHAALDLRHAAASVAVLRRLLRRELREQRAVRRRHHAGADPGRRRAVPRHPRAVGAHAVRRIDRRLDRRRAPGPLPGLLRRLVCAAARTRVDFRYHQIVDIYKDANAYFSTRAG